MAQRLARMVWDHEVGGSNPLTPTMNGTSLNSLVRGYLLTHQTEGSSPFITGNAITGSDIPEGR